MSRIHHLSTWLNPVQQNLALLYASFILLQNMLQSFCFLFCTFRS